MSTFGMMGTGVDRAQVLAVPPEALVETDATPGIMRKVALNTDRAMLVRATCEAHVSSGWHHHGDRDVLGHVLQGRVRFEYGPGGTMCTEVGEGGYFHVPAGLVHRDVNPGDQPQDMVIAFVGTGPLVVNLDGPQAPRGG